MTQPSLAQLRRHNDALRLPGGDSVLLRFAEPQDADRLQRYFRSLSAQSRFNRLMGAAPELPQTQLDRFVAAGDGGSYSVLVTAPLLKDAVIGEIRYALDPDSGGLEFGLSVDDRWQGRGLGSVLLANLECRAAAAGATHLFGDTLRSNAAMIGLARKAGFRLAPRPTDWKQVRFEKPIAFPWHAIPCASWRLAAAAARTAAAP